MGGFEDVGKGGRPFVRCGKGIRRWWWRGLEDCLVIGGQGILIRYGIDEWFREKGLSRRKRSVREEHAEWFMLKTGLRHGTVWSTVEGP